MSNTTSQTASHKPSSKQSPARKSNWHTFGYLLGTLFAQVLRLILHKMKTWTLIQRHLPRKLPASRDFPETLYAVPAYVRRKHIPLKRTQY